MINLSDYRNIHCIGIGGVGVSAIAEILLSRGYHVSGSDMKQSDLTDRLAADGVKVYIGHSAENVEDADLIVYSAAIAEENPEVIRAREKNIPLASRAEVLGVLMDDFKNSIAICGTHGKTTTTSMVSLILDHAKLDPTILVGGNLAEIGGNVRVGQSEFFVTEACEYRDSFLELRPRIEVILNIDSDHLDYFKDIDHIVRSFDQFAKAVPADGIIVAYDANPFVNQVIKDIPGAITFGYNENCTYHIANVHFDENGRGSFDMYHQGENLGTVKLQMPGEHNILNAVAAFACCHQLGVAPEVIIDTLDKFTGTQRRFDIQGTTKAGVKVVDDYAHHPTEIKATLSAAKNIHHNKLWCLFQPHTYTRTLALFDEFADAFGDADVLILAEIYAAREKNIYKISSKGLLEEIIKKHPDKEVYYMESFEEMAAYVKTHAVENDLVLTMGAGDIYKVGEMILEE
ncbi:MAG: UDP-N-acetylmuramate--L-alanine ligase [Firmicutes bacterium]|nr:UDP-N-acetylmuramate--L-alanine ligase [Bacillota bacterium]